MSGWARSAVSAARPSSTSEGLHSRLNVLQAARA